MFAVSAGPGSFTGLRVGLVAAKGWAEVYNKPVVGVSVLEAIAAQSNSAAAVLVPAFDARRGEVYFGVYRRGKKSLALEGDECVSAAGGIFANDCGAAWEFGICDYFADA